MLHETLCTTLPNMVCCNLHRLLCCGMVGDTNKYESDGEFSVVVCAWLTTRKLHGRLASVGPSPINASCIMPETLGRI